MQHFKHKRTFSKVKGLTLIELMIVLMIMGLLGSLTGGMMIESVAKQERLVEVEKVKQIFQQLSYKAYYSGFNIEVTLVDNLLIAKGGDINKTITFNQLSFPESHLSVLTQAYVSPDSFTINWNESDRQIEIPSLFKPYENLNNEK